MPNNRRCALIRDNISSFNQRRSIVYRNYIELHNHVQRLPGDLNRMYSDMNTLEAADRAAGALRVNPAAWAIVQTLRVSTVGSAIIALRDAIRSKEQELREAQRQLPMKREAWEAVEQNLAASQRAFREEGCEG